MVRLRFAPSPTGYLHVGGLRTALFCWLYARKKWWKFIFRLEDTDQKRIFEGAENQLTNMLEWSGIEIDEGPQYGVNMDLTDNLSDWIFTLNISNYYLTREMHTDAFAHQNVLKK